MESTTNTLNYERTRPATSIRVLTLLLLCALGLALLALSGSIVGNVMYIQLWNDYVAGIAVSASKNQLANNLMEGTNIAIPACMAASFILLLCWMYRAQKILIKFSRTRLRFSPASVVISWVIPRWWYIRPYEAMKELVTVSRGNPKHSFTPLVGVWWACWLGAWALAVAAEFAGREREKGATDAQFAIDWATWHIIRVPAFLIAGVLLMIIVYIVDRAQARQQVLKSDRQPASL
jgi:hypothetical protein